jgi:DNA-binding transcriptional ArsR family regulator
MMNDPFWCCCNERRNRRREDAMKRGRTPSGAYQAGLTAAPTAIIFNHVVEHMPESLNRVFFALSDPTRRAILARLADGEVTVTAIAAPFAMSLAAVSKHIRVLEEAGLLERTRQGREHRLRFVAQRLREAADWVNRYRKFWTCQLDRLAEHLEQDKTDTEDSK